MYHLDNKKSPIYSLIDYERKSTTFDDERITSMINNLYSGNMFMYATSTGKINICDLRERSDFHNKASITLDNTARSSKHSSSVFSKWVSSVSDAKFVQNPYHIFSRDYLSVKLWDLRGSSSSMDFRH